MKEQIKFYFFALIIGAFFVSCAHLPAVNQLPVVRGFVFPEKEGKEIILATENGVLVLEKGENGYLVKAAGLINAKVRKAELISTEPVEILAATETNGLFLLTEKSSKKWVIKKLPLAISHIRTIAVDPANKNRFIVSTNEGIFLSEDKGASFVKISKGLEQDIYHLIFDPAEPGVVYAGNLQFFPFKFDWDKKEWNPLAELYPGNFYQAGYSTEGTSIKSGLGEIPPARWLAITYLKPSQAHYLLGFTATEKDIFFATGCCGICRIYNEKDKYYLKYIGLKGESVYSINVSPDGTIYAGTKDKVFISRDQGAKWEELPLRFTNESR